MRFLLGFAFLAATGLAVVATPCDGFAQTSPPPGEAFRDCEAACPELVTIPAGRFTMGSPTQEAGRENDEGPRRTVVLSRPFAVGRFEVTFDEWDACVAGGGCKAADGGPGVAGDAGWGRGRRPVINVSWPDAQAYASWLSSRTGKPYRLLSEAEWEYVARAGGKTAYASGERITPQAANYQDSQTNQSVPVGSYPPNRFGVHDMDGNVWEWVEDCYAASYAKAPGDGSASQAGDCGRRMLRGGAWNTPERFLRSAARGRNKVDFRDNDFGFRVARDLP